MVFSSMTFLSVFLVLTFVLSVLAKDIRIKNAILIVFSIIFYAVGEPVYVILMLASSFVNYVFGRLVRRRDCPSKLFLVLAIVFNLGMLVTYKYVDFFIEIINAAVHTQIPYTGLTMPIGISFFTFQAMSYVIDVYRGVCKTQKNFFYVLLYISFFPQLIAGPIIKYSDMEEQITNRVASVDDIEYGIRRFITGLSKKVLISNAIALVVDTLIADLSHLTMLGAWVVTIGYSLQIYYDFSGYSDMAIGLGRMFGFHFKENFKHPYAAISIKDFWRRWHISLSGWFRDYVYIPLGGNRKGKFRTFVNKFFVFFLTGFWHGANWTFMVWGLIHGIFSVLEESRYFKIEKVKGVRRIYTLLVVSFAFVIFRADSLSQGGFILARLFDVSAHNVYGAATLASCMTGYAILAFVLGILFAVPWWKGLAERLQSVVSGKMYEKVKNIAHIVTGVLLMGCLMICMIQLASDSYNPFIYFRF
ncbi:MAG: MBOAT family O-acyltransferase [Wujia sp.]